MYKNIIIIILKKCKRTYLQALTEVAIVKEKSKREEIDETKPNTKKTKP